MHPTAVEEYQAYAERNERVLERMQEPTYALVTEHCLFAMIRRDETLKSLVKASL